MLSDYIGRHYDIEKYHCANLVSDWYYDNYKIIIPVETAYDISFTRWMRKNFKPINKPINGCIVRAKLNRDTHVGIYISNGVLHNFKPFYGKGSVVHWDMGVMYRFYDKLEFFEWSGSNIIQTQ